jgi:hypothetical protein
MRGNEIRSHHRITASRFLGAIRPEIRAQIRHLGAESRLGSRAITEIGPHKSASQLELVIQFIWAPDALPQFGITQQFSAG